VLPYCQEKQITVIAYSPLATGLNYMLEKDRLGSLRRIANLTGKTKAQVALNWCIVKNNVVAIPKANSIAHVEEDCDASGWQLSGQHLRLLDKSFQ